MAAERNDNLLQPSALVNEVFLRLLGGKLPEWANRSHFFAFSAHLMRQILVDFARSRNTARRGNRSPHVNLSHAGDLIEDAQTNPVDLIDLNNALIELAGLDPRQAQIVELRYFGGLENAEIAEVIGVSEPTVIRSWRSARAWLFSRLATSPPAESR